MRISFLVLCLFPLAFCACEPASTPEEEAARQRLAAAGQKQVRDEQAKKRELAPVGARFLGTHKSEAALFITIDGAANTLNPEAVRTMTCFDVATSPELADGRLEIRTRMLPPPGRETFSIGDLDVEYSGVLRDRAGRILWRGSQSTRLPITNMPGYVRLQALSPDQAKKMLLASLSQRACQPRAPR